MSTNRELYEKAKVRIQSGELQSDVLRDLRLPNNVYHYYRRTAENHAKKSVVKNPLRAARAPQVTSFVMHDEPKDKHVSLIILQGDKDYLERFLSLLYKARS